MIVSSYLEEAVWLEHVSRRGGDGAVRLVHLRLLLQQRDELLLAGERLRAGHTALLIKRGIE